MAFFTRPITRRLNALPAWQRTLWIMFVAQLCTAVGFSIIFPFLPLYVADLGTHTDLSIEFWAGMVFSAQAFTMMLASPLWGAVADRYGRKLMVQRAMFGGTVILLLMAFARSAEELVLLRAIQGMITGTVAAANALVAASAPRERTGYAMGVIQVGLWGGVAVGPLIGGVLADSFGFRMPFVITSVMLFIAGLMVHFGIQEDFTPAPKPADRTRPRRNPLRGLVANWHHIMHMDGVAQTYLVRFLAGLGRSMLVPITPLFVAALFLEMTPAHSLYPIPAHMSDMLLSTMGVSSMTGLVVGIASATATASGVYLGRLGDRIGHRVVLMGSALAAIFFYFPQMLVVSPWQLVVLQAMAGLAVGGLVAAPSALLARYTDPGDEGAVYGLDNSVLAAARAIAPLVGAGIAVVFGLRAVFLGMTLMFVVIVLVAYAALPRVELPRRSESAAEPESTEAVPAPAGD